MTDTLGPFDHEQDVIALPQVQAIHDITRKVTGAITREVREYVEGRCSALVTDECVRAGVTLGAYDARLVAWLGTWGPEECAVFAGLIQRAHEAGRRPTK